jgi:hypothetical protein
MPYKTQSPDTSPQMEEVYFNLLRRQSRRERLNLTRGLTASAIHRERQMIRKQHPAWSEQDVLLHWVTLAYGQEIADKFRESLQRREQDNAN